MPLKNYTTQIKIEKTIGEIEVILSKHGANAILKDYDGAGNITAVSFKVKTEFGDIPFKLPMNVKAVLAVFGEQVKTKKLPRRYLNNTDQARRVGWRIIKDWVDAQMAILELKMVKIQEVFLPYIYDPVKQQTFYQVLETKKFEGLLLENK